MPSLSRQLNRGSGSQQVSVPGPSLFNFGGFVSERRIDTGRGFEETKSPIVGKAQPIVSANPIQSAAFTESANQADGGESDANNFANSSPDNVKQMLVVALVLLGAFVLYREFSK